MKCYLIIFFIVFNLGNYILAQEERIGEEQLYRKAQESLERKDYTSAQEFLKEYLRIYPKGKYYPDCLYNLADLNIKIHNLQEAIEYLEKFCYSYPKDERTPQALITLASLYAKIGDRKKSINSYKRIIKHYDFTPHVRFAEYKLSKTSRSTPKTKPTNVMNEKDLLTKAKELYDKGEYQKARTLFNEFINLYPESKYIDYAHIKIAECLYYSGDYKGAVDKYNEFIKRFPESKYVEYAKYALGWSYYHLKDFLKAISAFENFLKNYPNSEYRESVEKILKRSKEIMHDKLAMELYKKALNLYKVGDLKGLIEAKDILLRILKDFKDTKYNELVENLLKEVKKKINIQLEESAKKLYEEAQEYIKAGNIKKARETLFLLIEKYPDTEYRHLAEKLLESLAAPKKEEKPESALKTELFKIPPPAASFKERIALKYYDIAKKYYELGEYTQAKERLEHLIKFYPETVYAKEAEKMMSTLEGLEIEKVASDYFQKGIEYYNAGDYNRAFSNFEKIIKDFKDTKYAQPSAAYLQLINEKASEDKAKELYTKAKEAQIKGKYNEAILYYEKILKSYPNSFWTPYARYGKAEIFYYHDKDYKSAIKEWEYILSEYPLSNLAPHALYRIALSLEALGEFKDAQSAYLRLKTSYPDSIYVTKEELRKIIDEKLKRP